MADQYQKVRDQFGPQAEKYVAAKSFQQTSDLDWLREQIHPQSNWRVLDIATGGGHAAAYFAPHVGHVALTDLTATMVEAASSHLATLGIVNFSALEAPAEQLPFDNHSFEMVSCRIAPHHFVSISKFLDEVARVLTPGGWFGLIDGIAPDDPVAARIYNDWERLRDPSHVACLSMSDWREALNSAGF